MFRTESHLSADPCPPSTPHLIRRYPCPILLHQRPRDRSHLEETRTNSQQSRSNEVAHSTKRMIDIVGLTMLPFKPRVEGLGFMILGNVWGSWSMVGLTMLPFAQGGSSTLVMAHAAPSSSSTRVPHALLSIAPPSRARRWRYAVMASSPPMLARKSSASPIAM